MPAKKPRYMKYVVAHSVIEGDKATREAQKWIDQGYQPWGVATITTNTLTKDVRWIQIFIKAKDSQEVEE